MENFTSKYAYAVINHRIKVLLATFLLILTAIAMIMSYPLRHNNSNEMWFLPGDPNLVAFEKLQDLFGSSEYLIVGVTARDNDKDIFEYETLMMINEISTMLEDHEIVEQVRSLSKYQRTYDKNGMVATDDLIEDFEELGDNPVIIENAREIIKGEELALDSIITSDLKHTRILARTEYRANDNSHKIKVVNDLRDFIKEKGYIQKGYDLKLGGVPYVGERFETISNTEFGWMIPTQAVIMFIILGIIFRSLAGMIVPWVVIATSAITFSGLQAFLGLPITVVNQSLTPITMLIGMATAVHVLSEFYGLRTAGLNAKDSCVKLIRNLLKPIFFTCLTTSIGFSALYVTKLVPVKEFAIIAAFIPLIVFLFSMTALPAALSFFSKMPKWTENTFKDGWLTKFTNFLPEFNFKYRKIISSIGGILLILSIYGVSQINVDTNIFKYFRADLKVTKDLIYFDNTYKGAANVEYLVTSKEKFTDDGLIKEPEFLNDVGKLEKFLEDKPDVGKGLTVPDFLKQTRQAFSGDDPSYFILPDTKEMTAQLLLLYENSGPEEDLSDLKDFDEKILRMTFPITNMDASAFNIFVKNLNAEIQEKFPSLNALATGPMVMFQAQNEYTDKGITSSFSVSLLLISITFFILFRSIKFGAIAIIPSVIPILLAGGIATVMGRDLNLGSLIVGAMTMGIAVDDSIHMVSRYRLARMEGSNVHQAMKRAMNESGRAIITTSIILVIGFSVFLMASLVPTIDIGRFSAIIFLLALFGVLFFIPSILYILDGKKEELQTT